jgi:hypothetical protein
VAPWALWQGVAVVEPPDGPFGGHGDLAVVVGGHGEGALAWVDVGEGGAGAVEQPAAVVIHSDDHLVAGPVLPPCTAGAHSHRVTAEPAGGQQSLPGEVVQQGDVGAADGQHHNLLRFVDLLLQLEVVGDDSLGQLTGRSGVQVGVTA